MDSKLERIRNLINEKERIDTELTELLGFAEKKIGRPRKQRNGDGTELPDNEVGTTE